MNNLKFRHEWKHIISFSDLLVLRNRLKAVMQVDKNAINGQYFVRSLYFDNLQDKALNEKINGINNREKFRFRYYNDNNSCVFLEKKSKINGLCNKQQQKVSVEQVNKILSGDINSIVSDNSLFTELCIKMKTQGLFPKTIVSYQREPFVFPAGNTRVTLDYNIRSGLKCTDFLNIDHVTVPTMDKQIILEVKWDEFLPSVIRDIVQMKNIRTTAFSKYAFCRIYD